MDTRKNEIHGEKKEINERRHEMGGYNRVVLMGNLTRDPEVRQIASGAMVCDLGLAVTEVYKNGNGENVETTCFVDVVTWRRQAETCGQYLNKGAPVLVEGRLQLDQWETSSGEKRSKLRVRADRVKFLSWRKSGQSGNGNKNPANAPAVAAPVSSPQDDNVPF